IELAGTEIRVGPARQVLQRCAGFAVQAGIATSGGVHRASLPSPPDNRSARVRMWMDLTAGGDVGGSVRRGPARAAPIRFRAVGPIPLGPVLILARQAAQTFRGGLVIPQRILLGGQSAAHAGLVLL